MNTERAPAAVKLHTDQLHSHSLREQLAFAALRQGPSFVVLLLVLFGVWRVGDYLITQGIAAAIEQIKAGYREIQTAHDANLRELIAAFERDQQQDRAVLELVRDVVENREILKASHAILVELNANRHPQTNIPRDALPHPPPK